MALLHKYEDGERTVYFDPLKVVALEHYKTDKKTMTVNGVPVSDHLYVHLEGVSDSIGIAGEHLEDILQTILRQQLY